jgi:hypothetical protein
LEKSPWNIFLRGPPSSSLPQPNLVGTADPRRRFPWDVIKSAPVPRGPHLSASHLHGRETATHPTRYHACYAQTRPLSSALASCQSPAQFRSTDCPRAVPQHRPAESPLLRRLAPLRTESSPRTTERMCRCHARIVTMPSELLLSTLDRRLTDEIGTRQGTHVPPRLLLASHRVASHR